MTAPGSSGTPTRRERREQQDKAGARRRTVVIIVVVVAVIAAAVAGWYFFIRSDDSSSSTSSSSTSSSTASSSTSSSTSSTTTTSSASTSSTSVPTPPADPQAYAQTLFTAWSNNDRTAAATVANQTAIDSLFATPSSDAPSWAFSGCQGAAGSIFCTWTRAGGQLAMTVRDATGGLPVQVVDVTIGPG
jgi:flagellar basal body-associated protein FliL